MGNPRFTTQDPLAEKYYSISPYAYCANNPMNRIDPTGMDTVSIQENGFVDPKKRISSKTDVFFMVDSDGNKKVDKNGNFISLSFDKKILGNIDEPTVGVTIKNKQTNKEEIIQTKLTIMEIKGDKEATQLFEFLAQPGKTTNVEWTHAKIDTQISGRNKVGTSHETDGTPVGSYLNSQKDMLREVNHNHPGGNLNLSPGDGDNRTRYLNRNPGVKMNIYVNGWGYRPYTTFNENLQHYPPILK
jgi:hypothetical protein